MDICNRVRFSGSNSLSKTCHSSSTAREHCATEREHGGRWDGGRTRGSGLRVTRAMVRVATMVWVRGSRPFRPSPASSRRDPFCLIRSADHMTEVLQQFVYRLRDFGGVLRKTTVPYLFACYDGSTTDGKSPVPCVEGGAAQMYIFSLFTAVVVPRGNDNGSWCT